MYQRGKRPSYVYEIKNIIINKVYFGETAQKKYKNGRLKRWHDHLEQLRKGTHHNKEMQQDYNTYGENAFIFKIVKEYAINCVSRRETLESKLVRQAIENGLQVYNDITKLKRLPV